MRGCYRLDATALRCLLITNSLLIRGVVIDLCGRLGIKPRSKIQYFYKNPDFVAHLFHNLTGFFF